MQAESPECRIFAMTASPDDPVVGALFRPMRQK